jgi:hypothetical protein
MAPADCVAVADVAGDDLEKMALREVAAFLAVWA